MSDSSTAPSATGRLPFRPDIEGLRAVAIIFVVLYHTGWKRLTGGFLGVDVFFVLSGFLITGILLDEIATTGRVSLVNFWARRARRLLPAALVVTVVVLVADAILLTPFEQIVTADSARAFAVYGSNILFANRATNYFGGAAGHDGLLHTWSLSVEEQFYLFFAPTLMALAAWSMRRGHDTFTRRFWMATIGVTVGSLAGCLFMIRSYPLVAFYVLPPRAWEFGLGALAAVAVLRRDRLSGPVLEGVSLAAMAGLVGSAALVNEGTMQPLGLATIVPTLSATALILCGAGTYRTLVARLLCTSPMRLIGRLSYSWYLWHWPVLVLLPDVVRGPSLTVRMAAAALSLIPAAITYRFVESPIRFSKGLQRRARLAVSGAVVLAATTVVMGSVAIHHANTILATPSYAPIVAARELPAVYDNGCHLTIPTVDIPPCTFGPGTNDTTIAIFGDSHSAQWFPALESIARRRGWTFMSMTKSACASVSVTVYNGILGREFTECDDWRRRAIARINAAHPALVVVVNTRAYEVKVGNAFQRTDLTDAARREWHDGMARTLAALAPSGARLMVVKDNAHESFDISRCLVKNMAHQEYCAVSLAKGIDADVAAAEQTAVQSAPRATYADINPFVCDTNCPSTRNGMVLYQDGNHLSKPFILALMPRMEAIIDRVLAGSR